MGPERHDYMTHERVGETYFLTYPFHPSKEPPHRCLAGEEPSEDEVKSALAEHPYEDEFVCICRGLSMDEDDFQTMTEREGIPKSRLNEDTARLIIKVLKAKLEEYEGGPTSQEDEERVYGRKANKPGANERNAIVVRLGEKRVLESHIALLRKYIEMEKKRQEAKEKERQRLKRRSSQGSIGKGYGGEKEKKKTKPDCY